MNIELNELNLEEIGTWPRPIRLLLVVIACVIVAGIAFWFDTLSQLDKLDYARQQEQKLRLQFEEKQQQAANLASYRQQLVQIKQSLGKLIDQLPAHTEVPALLKDISKTGVAAGLRFDLVKPLPEEQHEFIAELPIEITVIGRFHQLGNFVSHIVALSRIVTLHNFEIKIQKLKPNEDKRRALLQMDITAKTYRYNT